MMVSVVMSSATRVPGFSLALSTFVRQPTTYRGPLLAFTMTADAQNWLNFRRKLSATFSLAFHDSRNSWTVSRLHTCL